MQYEEIIDATINEEAGVSSSWGRQQQRYQQAAQQQQAQGQQAQVALQAQQHLQPPALTKPALAPAQPGASVAK